jgi:outer membrane biosynthesis protein TonB
VITEEAPVSGPWRRSARAAVALVLVALVTGCGEDGPSLPALPTALPTEVPTVDVPSPDITAELPTLPTRSPRPTDDPAEPTQQPTQPTEEPAPPPTTAAPAVPPTQEAGPTEESQSTPEATPTPAATETTAAAAAQDEGVPWWVWLLAALLLAAVVGLLVVWNRRRAARAAWDDRLTAAVDEMRWLEGSLVPSVLRAGTAAEAASVWAAGRSRALATDEEIFALASSAPDDDRRARAVVLRERLGNLTSAVDADTATDARADAEGLRARRGAIEQARADLLAALDAATAPDPGV